MIHLIQLFQSNPEGPFTASQGLIITTMVGLALFIFVSWSYTHFPGDHK